MRTRLVFYIIIVNDIIFANAGKLQLAIEIYNRMMSEGILPSIQTYNTMIR